MAIADAVMVAACPLVFAQQQAPAAEMFGGSQRYQAAIRTAAQEL